MSVTYTCAGCGIRQAAEVSDMDSCDGWVRKLPDGWLGIYYDGQGSEVCSLACGERLLFIAGPESV